MDFLPLFTELDRSDGHLQTEEFTPSNVTAQHLQLTLHSGYDHFISVHKLSVDGNAVHG